MGIRETINRNSVIFTIVLISALVIVAVVIGLELRGNNGAPPKENFFTIDDGQTWFVDSASKLPPFDHDGAQAVRCYVFKGPSGKFAGLLEKYNDSTRDRLAHRDPNAPLRDPPPVMVKKPGEKDWNEIAPEQESMMLMHITGPDGSGIERFMP